MSDIDTLEGDAPPEALDHLIDELIDLKEERGEELELEWIPEEQIFQVMGESSVPVVLFTSEIDSEFYGESEAVVVEADLGLLRKAGDLVRHLRYSYEEQVYSRLALEEGEDGDRLVLQAALPLSHVSPEQLDGMIREVGAIAGELMEEEPPSGTA